MYAGTELGKAPLRTDLVLIEARTPDSSRQRLSSLGLRVGTRFMLISKTAGGGRVALVAGSRIALGASLLPQLSAEVSAR